jgi:hypothetical protein
MEDCRRCGVPLTDKNWHPSLRRKRHLICNGCHLVRGQKWRDANRKKVRAINTRANASMRARRPTYSRDWSRKDRAQLRIESLAEYGGKCIRCGISDARVLDLDHINNDGASERRKNGRHGWALMRWLKKHGYPKDRFQLMCRNCNWIKECERKDLVRARKS